MNKPVVVLVGAGIFQLPAILEAKRLGYYVIAIDGAADAAGFEHADKYFVADIKNAELCIDLVKGFQPVAVFALATEIAVVSVAKICNYFGLPGIGVEAALNSTNKRRMRECFARENLPSPRFFSLTHEKQLKEKAEITGFPLVIKPVDSAGSRGVSIVLNEAGLIEAFAHAKKYATSGEVLLEEFMEGVEISVEAYVQNGKVTILSLSDKIRTPLPYPLDTRVIFPGNKDKSTQERAKDIGEKAILACGIDNAVIHIEMMVTPDGPKLVELAARGAGFHVFSKILSWVCDINTVELLINLSVGNRIELNHLNQKGAVLSFPKAKKGIVQKVIGFEEIQKIPGIYDAKIYVKPGDKINELRSGADRVGHIIAFADDRETALSIADEAEKKLHIEVS